MPDKKVTKIKKSIKDTKLTKVKPEEKPEKKVKRKTIVYHAVGRRKEAIAQVHLILEKGDILVNSLTLEQYFSGNISKIALAEPFRTTNTVGRWSGKIKVTGGGIISQLQAVILAISRCLVKYDTERNKPILRKRGYLTVDARVKERKKPGLMGARKKKQSPKR